MPRYAWLTDIHIDSHKNQDQAIAKLMSAVTKLGVDGLILTGDISIGPELVYTLSVIERELKKPIFYVLGNHDMWKSSIDVVHRQMRELSGMSPYLKWLPAASYLPISTATCIVGHDGWYDAMNGDPFKSSFMMNDWGMIHEFVNVGGMSNRGSVVGLSRKLAHEATTHVMNSIKAAVRYHKTIVVATHIPPFIEASTYQGRPTEMNAAPFYTSRMMGDMLRQAAVAYPDVKFVVLAGHTHSKSSYVVSKNMTCTVGGAEYGKLFDPDVLVLP